MADTIYTVHETSNPAPALRLVECFTMFDALAEASCADTAEERAHFIAIWSDMFTASFERPRCCSAAPLRLVPEEPTVN